MILENGDILVAETGRAYVYTGEDIAVGIAGQFDMSGYNETQELPRQVAKVYRFQGIHLWSLDPRDYLAGKLVFESKIVITIAELEEELGHTLVIKRTYREFKNNEFVVTCHDYNERSAFFDRCEERDIIVPGTLKNTSYMTFSLSEGKLVRGSNAGDPVLVRFKDMEIPE